MSRHRHARIGCRYAANFVTHRQRRTWLGVSLSNGTKIVLGLGFRQRDSRQGKSQEKLLDLLYGCPLAEL